MDSVFSKRIKAGKRRTYFFDVKSTKANDYFLTITESRRKFNDDGYDRHKIFLYKEDFNKFVKGLGEAVDFVKTELMPDFDFDAFNHEYPEGQEGEMAEEHAYQPTPQVVQVVQHIPEKVAEEKAMTTPVYNNTLAEEVDKW